MSIWMEYIIVFMIVYVIYYFINIKGRGKKGIKKLPELLYLEKIYKIKISKDKLQGFIYVSTFVNTFIITTIYIILIYLVPNYFLKFIVGMILLILMTIICYGLLGRYYLWKEGDK